MGQPWFTANTTIRNSTKIPIIIREHMWPTEQDCPRNNFEFFAPPHQIVISFRAPAIERIKSRLIDILTSLKYQKYPHTLRFNFQPSDESNSLERRKFDQASYSNRVSILEKPDISRWLLKNLHSPIYTSYNNNIFESYFYGRRFIFVYTTETSVFRQWP